MHALMNRRPMQLAGTLAATVIILSPLAAKTNAAVTYNSATRTAASQCFGGTPQNFSSTAFGPLTLTASSTGTQCDASGSITSDLLPDRITFNGGASASDFFTSSGGGAGSGSASLSVQFTLDAPTAYSLVGPAGGNPGNQGAGYTDRLVRTSDNVTLYTFAGVDQFGTLPAGTYSFIVSASAGVNGIGTSGGGVSFNRVFALPGPGSAAAVGLGALMIGTRRRRHA